MTAQFHAGQEVEVYDLPRGAKPHGVYWRKAKILGDRPFGLEGYWVQFPDGTRTVFDAEHIREVPNRDLAKMTPDELQEDVNDCYCGGRGKS